LSNRVAHLVRRHRLLPIQVVVRDVWRLGK
jgi:hypothetical protein